MKVEANNVEGYMENIAENHQASVRKLREIVKLNLPKGFEETMNYGMIGYVVPHDLYPKGYHCDPKLPLPFMNIASQKNFIAFYHMGIYAMPELYAWFMDAYAKLSSKKIDMGKSCIRFKKPEDIPFELLGELVSKVSVSEWISVYELAFRSNKK